MREKSKTLLGQDAELQSSRIIPEKQSISPYNNSAKLILDLQKLDRDSKHYRSVTLEKRVCQCRLVSSVPFTNVDALQNSGRWS